MKTWSMAFCIHIDAHKEYCVKQKKILNKVGGGGLPMHIYIALITRQN